MTDVANKRLCVECQTEIRENTNFLKCNLCQSLVHGSSACSSLSRKEVHSVITKSRKLLFLCNKCCNESNGFGPYDHKAYDSFDPLHSIVKSLKEDLDQIKLEMKMKKSIYPDMEKLIAEFKDRKKRESNVMFYKIDESKSTDPLFRARHDKEEVTKRLKQLPLDENIPAHDIKCFRIGKPILNKKRPVKVVFNSPNLAMKILSFKNKIPKELGFSIGYDQTPAQRKYFADTKSILQERMKTESDLALKFINGIPTIVKYPMKQLCTYCYDY